MRSKMFINMKPTNHILVFCNYKKSFFLVVLFSLLLFLFGCGSLTSLDYANRIKAVNRINDQTVLIKVALEDVDWRVRNAAFDKLNTNSLTEICNLTKDQGIVIAAKIRLKQTTWTEEFSKSTNSSTTLGNVIGAAALVNTPQPTSSDVVSACHKYIRQGDASRIPELINLLNRFGNVTLAEDYMNCGESTLSDAGCTWGQAHGYRCTTGYGSNRVRWGSEK